MWRNLTSPLAVLHYLHVLSFRNWKHSNKQAKHSVDIYITPFYKRREGGYYHSFLITYFTKRIERVITNLLCTSLVDTPSSWSKVTEITTLVSNRYFKNYQCISECISVQIYKVLRIMDYSKYSIYCFPQTTEYTLSSLVGKSEICRWVKCLVKHFEKKKNILWRIELKKWLT